MKREQVVFVDTETTGLDPDRHKVWEVGLIYWREGRWVEYSRMISYRGDDDINRVLENADPFALQVGHFYERYPNYLKRDYTTDWWTVGREVVELTAGKHLCGAIVSFDEERLRKLVRRAALLERWHYHIIDIEAMSVGYLLANQFAGHNDMGKPLHLELPWKSERIFELLCIEGTPEEDKHTALGDARQVKLAFEKMVQWEN